MRWFDREFEFTLPTELHPVIVERLRGLLPRVRAKIALPGVDLRRRADDKWSIQENIGHLLDLDALFARRVEEFFAGVDVLEPADLENTKTHTADHNSRDVDELIAELATSRNAMIARLDAASNEDFDRRAKHPRLDRPMRLFDHVLFVAEHDDHHLAASPRSLAGDRCARLFDRLRADLVNPALDLVVGHEQVTQGTNRDLDRGLELLRHDFVDIQLEQPWHFAEIGRARDDVDVRRQPSRE